MKYRVEISSMAEADNAFLRSRMCQRFAFSTSATHHSNRSVKIPMKPKQHNVTIWRYDVMSIFGAIDEICFSVNHISD